MPDPVWTAQYNYSATPEANGFTRRIDNSPLVNIVSGGTPANRRVDIQSDNGEAIFLTSAIPSLDETVGATAEAVVSTTGPGHAGFELSFLNRAFLVQVFLNKIMLTIAQDAAPGQIDLDFPTAANNAAGGVLIRATYSDGTLTIYRNGVLVGSATVPASVRPFQRLLWWAEGGGMQTFRGLRYYVGGAIPPG